MSARPRSWAWLLAPCAIALVATIAPTGSSSAAPVPGEAGVLAGLPATESAVKVGGRGRFADMEFTISQTADLTTQAISITWTGGIRTTGPGNYGAHFVQAFQCWGDDDGTNQANPGPPPEQCQQGARAAQPDPVNSSLYPLGNTLQRVISNAFWSNSEAVVASGAGVQDPKDTVARTVWRPFRAVNGQKIDIPVDVDFNQAIQGGNFWQNPFFNILTTNEIAGGRTRENGTGAELFQLQTGLDAPGLGCGQRVQPQADGSKKVPRCWLVIVPRGDADDENIGATPFETNADQAGVQTSPLMPGVWANRIAVPLEFKPLDSPCDLADSERRIVGSELAQAAVSSWQPVLCSTDTLPPYSFAPVGDAAARQQLSSSIAGGPGMVLVSRPLSAAAEDPKSPAVYAPVSAGGLVIGFNIERIVVSVREVPTEQILLTGLRVERLNLTPRLIAKLLTQSYRSQRNINGVVATDEWAAKNSENLLNDPDFLRFNPEFEYLRGDERRTGGLQLPSGSFDAASQIWAYVFADPEATAWMKGAPDEWGMRVNPVFAADPGINPLGIAFGEPLPNSFPKSDPLCYQAPKLTNNVVPPALCGTDWVPYTRNFAEASSNVGNGSDPARVAANPFAQSATDYWKREAPAASGERAMFAITDTASAARFGLQTAALSQAGDNGTSRTFIAANVETLTAGVATMKPKTSPKFLEPDPTSRAANAYPLTTLTYAAIKPLSLDESARSEYASFIEYASTTGQVPGFDFGELPPGYAPLPTALVEQAAETAKVVRTPSLIVLPGAPAAQATTTPSSGSATPSTGGASSPQVVSTGGTSNSRPTSSGSSSRPTSSGNGVVQPIETPPSTEVPATTVAVTSSEVPATTVVVEAAPPTTVAAPSLTPGFAVARTRYIVVGLGVLALLAALFALEITKRTRRMPAGDEDAAEAPQPAHAPVELTLTKQTVDA